MLGAPLNFIDMLYSVFPICGYIDLYLDLFQELLKESVTLKRYAATDLQAFSETYLEGM